MALGNNTFDYCMLVTIFIGVWAGRGQGGGGTCPPEFLRSGKKQCKIRAKLKNFGKILMS